MGYGPRFQQVSMKLKLKPLSRLSRLQVALLASPRPLGLGEAR